MGFNQTGSTADFPSGQRELTVNQSPRASVVRIHYPPRLDSSVVEHFLGKEEVVSSSLIDSSKRMPPVRAAFFVSRPSAPPPLRPSATSATSALLRALRALRALRPSPATEHRHAARRCSQDGPRGELPTFGLPEYFTTFAVGTDRSDSFHATAGSGRNST